MNFLTFFKKKGFTLIELMVVMSIATIMMAVLIFQQNKWSDQLSVNTQAYEMVLMIRQAQIYSLGVREDTGGTGDKFNVGYGIYMNQSNANQYIYFADRDGDQKYDSGEAIETKTFSRGVTIKDVCGSSNCFFVGGGPLWQASISFFRPETKANIKLLNNGGNPVDTPPVTIKLQSSGGREVNIIAEANGQVSVQ
ncbi:MAG: hypothetical protein UR50_C0006G0011 [Parcubacteria group bacterium GW2011_GWC1_34_10]|uniref:General secretion pathway GspH domain-containing protein n=1 Tax=Candidatus Zambryskibacteria bacterium RIFCSPLOWO2_01_FULL_35_19 TaxID=1802757 RepID=A0A1G2TXB0_9BACT|nr:MAG: hypothetical protein UR50_C0006G0011 [Parcubacteria group bacterium GW2011_GWC1_34_10]OHA86018.1 MAG: hypothetical protein A2726_01285 [Candidatus Zambryskibacteria bacterium RIFCSPHIGHO2_01_FULL_35_32]OHB01192.1 MAG: hypothetical protein A3A90_01570 [Candidatus Zambryskibacteria bacterium RIFCSPLOWO2_01_FULL_35_19]